MKSVTSDRYFFFLQGSSRCRYWRHKLRAKRRLMLSIEILTYRFILMYDSYCIPHRRRTATLLTRVTPTDSIRNIFRTYCKIGCTLRAKKILPVKHCIKSLLSNSMIMLRNQVLVLFSGFQRLHCQPWTWGNYGSFGKCAPTRVKSITKLPREPPGSLSTGPSNPFGALSGPG